MVHAHEVEVRLFGGADVQPVNVGFHLLRGLLVVFRLRYERGHAVGAWGEGGVEAAASANHIAGRQCQRLSVAHPAYRADHAARNLPYFRGRRVAVAENYGERHTLSECLSEFGEKLLYVHILGF